MHRVLRLVLQNSFNIPLVARSEELVWELYRLEGRGDCMNGVCSGCSETLPGELGVRCDECGDMGIYCIDCCLTIHARLPLHRLEVSSRLLHGDQGYEV